MMSVFEELPSLKYNSLPVSLPVSAVKYNLPSEIGVICSGLLPSTPTFRSSIKNNPLFPNAARL